MQGGEAYGRRRKARKALFPIFLALTIIRPLFRKNANQVGAFLLFSRTLTQFLLRRGRRTNAAECKS